MEFYKLDLVPLSTEREDGLHSVAVFKIVFSFSLDRILIYKMYVQGSISVFFVFLIVCMCGYLGWKYTCESE